MSLAPIEAAARDLLLEWAGLVDRAVLSADCADTLRQLIGDTQAVALVAAYCSLYEYGNRQRHADELTQAMTTLRRSGCRFRRGKRTRPEMDGFVSDVVGVALAYGVPLATGDNSRMVRILRCVAGDIGLRGDPRTELRCKVREDGKSRAATRRLIFERFAEALRSSPGSPVISPLPGRG